MKQDSTPPPPTTPTTTPTPTKSHLEGIAWLETLQLSDSQVFFVKNTQYNV